MVLRMREQLPLDKRRSAGGGGWMSAMCGSSRSTSTVPGVSRSRCLNILTTRVRAPLPAPRRFAGEQVICFVCECSLQVVLFGVLHWVMGGLWSSRLRDFGCEIIGMVGGFDRKDRLAYLGAKEF